MNSIRWLCLSIVVSCFGGSPVPFLSSSESTTNGGTYIAVNSNANTASETSHGTEIAMTKLGSHSSTLARSDGGGGTDDGGSWDQDFDEWNEKETAESNAKETNKKQPSPIDTSQQPLPTIAPLPSPTTTASTNIPILKPPPTAASTVIAPTPPTEVDLFSGMGMSISSYVDAPRLAAKIPPSTTTPSTLKSSSAVSSSSTTSAASRTSNKFDLDYLMNQDSQSTLSTDGWGEETSLPVPSSTASSSDPYSTHSADVDIDLDIDLKELGLDVDDQAASLPIPSKVTHTAASTQPPPKEKKSKKAKVGLLAAPVNETTNDIDIDIDLDDIPV